MPKSSHYAVLGSAIAAAAVIVASALALKHWVTAPVPRGIVATVPIPFYVAFVVITIRHVRQLDGLQQRLCLEAMTFAATLTGLAALSYAQLETARLVPAIDVGLVAPALMLLYAVGYFASLRRYQ
jgi:hypothetical protein